MALVVNTTWTGKLVDGEPQDPQVINDGLEALMAGVNNIDNSQIISTANISGSKLASGTITELQLGTGSVGQAELQTDAVIEDKILNGAVTADKLGAQSLGDGKLNWNNTGDEVGIFRAWQSQRHMLYGVADVAPVDVGSPGSESDTVNFSTALNYDGSHVFNTTSIALTATVFNVDSLANDNWSVVIDSLTATAFVYRVGASGSARTDSNVKLCWMAIGDWV